MFDFVARRSAGRGCTSQVQIAGARVVLDCTATNGPAEGPGQATNIYIGVEPGELLSCNSDADCGAKRCVVRANGDKKCLCVDDAGCTGGFGSCDVGTGFCWQAIEPIASYELATSNYLAGGGSGFRVLQRNTTQFDTLIQQRDALIDYIRAGDACGDDSKGNAVACAVDGDCAMLGDGFVCACPEAVVDTEGGQCAATGVACRVASGAPGSGDGACVLERCRDDVADVARDRCDKNPTEATRQQCLASLSPCANGGEQCKFLACIDASLGNASDGRVRMVGK
jgi:5'-nucleotidase